jgi:hypothetical protein
MAGIMGSITMVLILTQGPILVQVLVSIVFVAFGWGVNVRASGSAGMAVGGIDVTVFVESDPPAAVPQAEDAVNINNTAINRNTLRFVVVQHCVFISHLAG